MSIRVNINGRCRVIVIALRNIKIGEHLVYKYDGISGRKKYNQELKLKLN